MDKQAFDLMMKRFDSVENGISDLKEGMGLYGERIESLEDTRTQQRGIMIGGGAVVTFFAGLAAWLVDHFYKGGQ